MLERTQDVSRQIAIRTNGTALGESDFREKHQRFLAAATSDNTRRAYRSAIRHFQAWGGTLPCEPSIVMRYLLTYAEQLNARTLALRLTALSQWHRFQGFMDPTERPDVRLTLRGIARTHGQPKKKAKALPVEDLELMVKHLSASESVIDLRNNALLQIVFFGALRRSELVKLTVENIQWEADGMVITLPRSKTDQEGEGILKAIPYGDCTKCCPATALRRWLARASITSGPIFRRVTRWGLIGSNALDAGSVNTVLTSCAEAVGLTYVSELSSHSFRRGLATSAIRAGADFGDVKRQGGWRNDATVNGYIEEATRFEKNAAGSLLKRSTVR
jgi:integrase